MSRSTTPGSMGREIFSHSESDSSDLAGKSKPRKGEREIAAAVSAIKFLRLREALGDKETNRGACLSEVVRQCRMLIVAVEVKR